MLSTTITISIIIITFVIIIIIIPLIITIGIAISIDNALPRADAAPIARGEHVELQDLEGG